MRIALRAMGVTVLAVPALCLPCAAQQKAVPAAPVAVAQQPKIPTDRTAQVVSETYLGMLVCADCGGLRTEVTLYWEGSDGRTPIAYHMTETPIGAAEREPTESEGFFTEHEIPVDAQPTDKPIQGTLVQFVTGAVVRSFLRVAGNSGELLVLDAKMRVLPEDVPHSLGRVTGQQQHGLTLLTERDDGRTVQMRGGEVFLVVLPLPKSLPPYIQYAWSSDRPGAMALLEPESEHAPPTEPAQVPAKEPVKKAMTANQTQPVMARRRAQAAIHEPGYQAWQMVAPPEETRPVERTIVFELKSKNANEIDTRPRQIVTLRIVVQ